MQDFLFYIESSKIGNISTINKFLLKHRLHNNNATTQNFKNFSEERKTKYSEFQKYSLEKSGFKLNKTEINLINKVLAEKGGKCDSVIELKELYNIFKKMLKQGKENKIDFYDELYYLCKLKISEQIKNINIFEDKIF
jgi:hypothetical protein